jgi:lysophospholipase L1-like esterase
MTVVIGITKITIGKIMIDCLIIGDSIAVGTHQFRQECVAYAKGGWNSWQWNRDYLKNDLTANTVIISLGSNDHKGVRTKAELQRIREKVGTHARVFWILPAIKLEIQDIVRAMATEYGDTVLPITRLQTDGVHPSWAGYKSLADQTR